MKSTSSSLVAGLALLLLSISGCGGSGPTVQTGTVSGKVTLDGQPLPDVTVSFFEEKTAIAGSGDAGPDGTYKLMYAGGPKIPVGTYQVRITAKEEPMKPGAAAGSEPPPAPKPFAGPKKYEDFKTSGLTATVKAEDQKIDFPLKKE